MSKPVKVPVIKVPTIKVSTPGVPSPVVDAPLVSVVTIYRREDTEYVPNFLRMIPKDIPVILCETKPGGDGETEVIDKRFNVTFAKWHYKKFDFSSARNAAKGLCNTEWIISLDIDDYVSPMDWDSLTAMVKQADKTNVGGVMAYVHGCMNTGERMEYTHSEQIKIFRNRPDINWEGLCHEQLCWSLTNNGYGIGFSGVSIRHLGYERATDDEMLGKAERNFRLLVADMARLYDKDEGDNLEGGNLQNAEERIAYFKDRLIQTSILLNNFTELTNGKNRI